MGVTENDPFNPDSDNFFPSREPERLQMWKTESFSSGHYYELNSYEYLLSLSKERSILNSKCHDYRDFSCQREAGVEAVTARVDAFSPALEQGNSVLV